MTKVTATPSKLPRMTKPQLLKEIGRLERRLHAIESVENERKRAEETGCPPSDALALYRGLFDNVNSGVAVYEAVNGGEDFIFVDFNRAAEELEQISRDQIIGRKVTEVFPGVKEFGLFGVFSRVYLTGEPERHPSTLYQDGRITGWRDNHVFKLPETENIVAIYEEPSELRSILDSVFGFIGIYTTDGFLIEANRAPLEVAGLAREDVIGKPFWETYWWSHSPAVQDQVRVALERAASGETVREDFSVQVGPNEKIIIDASFAPLRDHRGRITHLIGFGVDITERKKAEDDLRKSREQLEEALESMADGFVIFDNQDRLVQYNSRFAEMFSGAFEVLESEPTFDEWARACAECGLMADAAGREDKWVAERINQHRGDTRPSEHRLHDGRWIRITEYKTKSGGTAGLRTDITERKQAEAALKESEELFRRSFEDAGVGAVMHHLDGRYRAVNDAFCRMLGYSKQELLGKNFADVSHPEDIDVGRNLLRQMAAGERQTAEMEKRYLHKDGSIVWVSTSVSVVRDTQGNALHTIAHIQDITERNRAEEALQESEARLDAFFTNAPIGLVIWDDQQRYLKVNDVAAEWNAMASEDHVGRTLSEVFPAYENTGIASFGRIMETGKPVLDQEFVAAPLSRPGDEMTWLISRFPIPGATKKPAGVGSVAIDITEQKRAEQEVQKLNTELEQRVEERTAELHATQKDLVRSERLATLGQLSATVSHELRNPLGTIRNSLLLIEAKVSGKKLGLEQEIERMARNVSRCDKIISELLEYARSRELIKERKAADAWLIDILDELAVPSKVMARRRLQAPKAVVAIDSDRLRRAVVNVHENACQAMAEYSENDEGERKLELSIRTKATKERFEMTIADTGPGMPSEVSNHAFEPLYSTKGFGVGLGLAIVKQIMEQHDGGIDIASQQGRGTQVTLWLPLQRTKRRKTAR